MPVDKTFSWSSGRWYSLPTSELGKYDYELLVEPSFEMLHYAAIIQWIWIWMAGKSTLTAICVSWWCTWETACRFINHRSSSGSRKLLGASLLEQSGYFVLEGYGLFVCHCGGIKCAGVFNSWRAGMVFHAGAGQDRNFERLFLTQIRAVLKCTELRILDGMVDLIIWTPCM